MNQPRLTDREAAALYERWHEHTEQLIRSAVAKAHGRRDRHASDLADLERDLGSVNLRGLLEFDTEPEAAPGTPAHAVADAARFLTIAEQHHTAGAHKPAIAYLQFAHTAADLAIHLADKPTGRPAARRTYGQIPPRPPARTRCAESPQEPGGHLPIPTQRE